MTAPLSDFKVHVKLKLSALWIAVMLCYIYGDLFGFFRQDVVSDIVAGKGGMIGTQTGLFLASIMMAIPSVMVFLALVLKPTLNRWLNLILGVAYTGIVIATIPHAWHYYLFLSVVEVILTLTIVYYAWTWPSQDPSGSLAS